MPRSDCLEPGTSSQEEAKEGNRNQVSKPLRSLIQPCPLKPELLHGRQGCSPFQDHFGFNLSQDLALSGPQFPCLSNQKFLWVLVTFLVSFVILCGFSHALWTSKVSTAKQVETVASPVKWWSCLGCVFLICPFIPQPIFTEYQSFEAPGEAQCEQGRKPLLPQYSEQMGEETDISGDINKWKRFRLQEVLDNPQGEL